MGNAKEKAWELYHKYRTLEGKFGDKVLYNYDAKQCALITIEEIIDSLQIKNYSQADQYEYWSEVKYYIEKL